MLVSTVTPDGFTVGGRSQAANKSGFDSIHKMLKNGYPYINDKIDMRRSFYVERTGDRGGYRP